MFRSNERGEDQHPRDKNGAQYFTKLIIAFDKLGKSWRRERVQWIKSLSLVGRPVGRLLAEASDQSAAAAAPRVAAFEWMWIWCMSAQSAKGGEGLIGRIQRDTFQCSKLFYTSSRTHESWTNIDRAARAEQTELKRVDGRKQYHGGRVINRAAYHPLLAQVPREHHSFAIYNSLKSISRCDCLPREGGWVGGREGEPRACLN